MATYPIIIVIYRLAVEAVLSHPSGTQALNKNQLLIKFKLLNLIKKIEKEKTLAFKIVSFYIVLILNLVSLPFNRTSVR